MINSGDFFSNFHCYTARLGHDPCARGWQIWCTIPVVFCFPGLACSAVSVANYNFADDLRSNTSTGLVLQLMWCILWRGCAHALPTDRSLAAMSRRIRRIIYHRRTSDRHDDSRTFAVLGSLRGTHSLCSRWSFFFANCKLWPSAVGVIRVLTRRTA